MKHTLIFLLSVAVFVFCGNTLSAQNNPVANPAVVVISGNMRFTVLTPEMIRIEYSTQQQFEDRASFIVVNRNLPAPAFTTRTENGFLHITTGKLQLQYKIGTNPVNNDPCDHNLQITMQVGGEDIVWYPNKKDPYNLKGTARTLDGADGDASDRLEDGLISRSGWAVIDEQKRNSDGSLSLMFDGSAGVDWVAQRQDPNVLDLYFLGYGHDYKKALSDYTKIAGKIPVPPLWAFGYWYSKYQRYTEQDFRDLVNEIRGHNLPADVMVIDMDWHKDGFTGNTSQTSWTGWTWNETLFPNPANFLGWLHSQNLKTTLNLHPADGVGTHDANFTQLANDLGLPTNQTIEWKIEQKPFYQAFFNRILRPHENIGVDFWWLDWQQWQIARYEQNLGNTFWLNHVFFNDMKLQGQKRPMIFHRWGGMGNHRYQIGFSGDAYSNFPSLAFQPYFTATASNVGYGYWSHDIGGHHQTGDNNAELYLRWIQYGVFSPILRTHSTNFAHIERRMWMYDNFPTMLAAVELRYALVPYIYTYARYAYDTGISLCRPMYYDFPESEQAYQYKSQYMFGNDILVAPIVASDGGANSIDRTLWLPEGKWYEAATGALLDGNQTVTRSFTREQIPYYYREGAIIPNYPQVQHLKTRPANLILQFAPTTTQSEFQFYEDEGDNDNYQNGGYTFTKITQEKQGNITTCTIFPRTGSFSGMLSERSYTLQLLAKDAPASVNFVSGTAGAYSYDATKKIITVELPAQPCSNEIKVTINE
ncbi:MAG: glycoside hydrolase family 31 protein [Dysgonamonadaceae bacterium]|jgi:alpha-glucosidase (family GH31 glycosyl hydrolase)|nr:glycoside hydrolase family 31 protein [Dysgonamonadaceae bacterium]